MFYASYRWSTIHVNGIDFTRNWGTGEEEEQSPEAKEDTESLRNDPFAGDTISLNGGGGHSIRDMDATARKERKQYFKESLCLKTNLFCTL